jgi:hypothetical protein
MSFGCVGGTCSRRAPVRSAGRALQPRDHEESLCSSLVHLGYTEGVSSDIDSHGETAHERRDRELIELLQELRVALPGVQVMFAFLLVLPFQSHFDRLPVAGRAAYGATLLAAALAAALLIAPTAIHRLNFRGHDKEWILQSSQRCLLAGTAVLAVSMVGAVFVVASALYGDGLAVVPTGVLACVLAWLWFLLPWRGPARPRTRG